MRNQLFAFTLLFVFVLMLGLLSLSGSVLAAGIPLLLYLLASDLLSGPTRVLVSRRLGATRVGPSTPIKVSVTLSNEGGPVRELVVSDSVPAGLRIVDGSPGCSVSLRAGAEYEFSYTVAGERGSYEFSDLRIESAGDFPVRASVRIERIPQELVSLPNHRALSRVPIAPRRTLVYAGSLPAGRGGEGTEFFDVALHGGTGRPRHINWRLSARRPDEVYVNTYQQERVADVGIILDARARAYTGDSGRQLFDAAATAAASLADVLLDKGNRVGFLAYGISLDWTAPGFGKVQKRRILTRIARLEPAESAVFFALDEIPERLLPPGSQLILVSPLTPDDAAPVMRLAALRYAVLVISPNPLPTEAAVPDALRFARAERSVLAHRLRHRGIPIVDWHTEHSFESAVTSSMGQIRALWRRRHVS